ncbi:MAG TPA: zeta toxin family protein, partial [Trueperaceae bacterium]|nr:zeta toxin family protein [Trueperaceae bacterium]
VIGHYETTCGGCDTISKMEHIFELARKAHDNGCDVVFEGLLISADVNRTAALWAFAQEQGCPMLVVALDVPLQVCLDSVNARRRERNPDLPPVNPRNTESKHKGVQQSMRRLEAAGVPAVSLDRDAALARIRAELGL